jgi:hypothetical protein
MDNNPISFINILVSLLVGGFAGTGLSILTQYLSEKKERYLTYVKEQLDKLYGPLYFLAKQNEKLFELNKRLSDAYTKEFIEKKWSENAYTQNSLNEDASVTIEIMNKYISQVEPNNLQIKKTLDENYAYSDPEDIDVFMLFYEHLVRLSTEKGSTGKLATPILIYKHLGGISFLRPEVAERIEEKYLDKKEELNRLIGRKSNKKLRPTDEKISAKKNNRQIDSEKE